MALVRSLLAQAEERAFLIVAPYGSGKSITLAYLLQLIENRASAQATLKAIEGRLAGVSPELHRFARRRRRQGRKGLVVALHGYCSDLPMRLKEAVLEAMGRMKLGRQARTIGALPSGSIEQAVNLLAVLQQKCRASGLDRISIMWDEAGRHIEALVSHGRASELADIQLLAEFASRSSDLPITLGLALHQALFHYAGQMPQSVRTEWMKISGRFQETQYIDDSREVYRLVSEVVAANRGKVGRPPRKRFLDIARRCRDDLGLFPGVALTQLAEMLGRAYPLEPIAFYLLPRVSARVAQYERTLFTFLYSVDMTRPISAADLYDYFSSAMRADTTVGGTYKQWLETQSALLKVHDDPKQAQVLKTACLLGLGTSGERARAGREMVTVALAGLDDKAPWNDTIDALIERNLLLHRKHNDELSVWHGTDFDLRGKLEEEKSRHAGSFALVEFLTREAPPKTWKPLQHNSRCGVCRYWEGEYVSPEAFASLARGEREASIPVGCDSKILYLLAEDHEQLKLAGNLAKRWRADPRLLVVVPARPLRARDAALEVFCLSEMVHNGDLVGSDPLVAPQLQQMMDDARSHLHRMLDGMLIPGRDGPAWFWQGEEMAAGTVGELRRTLSDIADQVFPLTPVIRNELVVRRKPSGTVVNSRKKLLLGILDRHGQENLGIRGHFPDYSMFRTVLVHTGLYREGEGRWGYVAPSCKGLERGIAAVWQKLQTFFGEPSEKPKRPADLLRELREPPYGVREGLLPILFAAGFKAFSRVVSLTKDGRYVTDVMPDDIEDLCRHPDSYALSVLALGEDELRYLRRLHSCFSPVSDVIVAENDLIRLCYDAIQGWKFQLPSSALATKSLSGQAMQFQQALREDEDPVKLLLQDLPAIAGVQVEKVDEVLDAIREMRRGMEGVAKTFVDKASASIRKALTHGSSEGAGDLRELASRWSASIPEAVLAGAVPAVAKGLLSRMQSEYDIDELLVESLSLLIVGRPISRWDDGTAVTFDSRLRDMVHRIEEAALDTKVNGEDRRHWEGMSDVIRQRLDYLLRQLVRLAGEDEARRAVDEVLRRHLSEKPHGSAS
ncbi:MAG TPA: hypothetical protein VM238_02780 [Phycisphaerae bacterium]|nr:hypothetical protein [Phycisphaerae bacterium]